MRHPNNRDGQPQIALWYLPALVRGPGRGLRTLCFAVLAWAAAVATLPGGGAAGSAGELERRAQALRAENQSLADGARSALGDLAAIERRLSRTRAELAAFRARTAQVRAQRQAVRDELRIARSSLRSAQRAIAKRLQTVYEQGETDTIAVVLGARSLDDMLSAIETLDLAATQDEGLLALARSTSGRLASLAQRLAGREREIEQLAAVRAAAAESLADARSDRLRTIDALRSASRSNTARISSLEERARTLASATAATAPVPGAPRLPPGAASSGVQSLTVVATGYSLPGRTASGMPVGWGAVAVDPSVIPMGSRLGIPGYGLGVAADVGSSIRGARIDLWFPTVGQARAWGSRVVTITVNSN
jgi:3D (Asp-Asp-Asp) domain-containing protein/peptidoglycan hydrolase CwlO-like protein